MKHNNKKTTFYPVLSPHSQEKGFTLIEVIVILIVLAIAASMAITYFGSLFLDSTTPYIMTKEQFNDDTNDPGVQESIERIIADYNNADDRSATSQFIIKLPSSANYDGSMSTTNLSITDIANTGTTLSFTKVVVRKNNQRIMAFFPIY